jgi:hypothetical protein
LIDHPAYNKEYRSLIHDDWINSYLAWPWEILNQRNYEGEPFGLKLDGVVREAELLEDQFINEQRAKLRPKNQLESSRINLRWAILDRK